MIPDLRKSINGHKLCLARNCARVDCLYTHVLDSLSPCYQLHCFVWSWNSQPEIIFPKIFLNSACALAYTRKLYFKKMFTKDYFRSQNLDLVTLSFFLFLRHGPTTNSGWVGTHCIDQASLQLLPLPGVKGRYHNAQQHKPALVT